MFRGKKIIFNLLLLSCLSFSVSGCKYLKKTKSSNPLARVGDQYLYMSDLKGIFPKGTNHDDSASIITTYVNNWIHNTLLLNKAKLNVKEDQNEFQKRIEDYKNSLLIYSFEKDLIKQNLDTVVTDSDIYNYYVANKDNFQLNQHIVKAIFAKVKKSASNQDKLRAYFYNLNDKNFQKVKKFITQNTHQFNLDTTKWMKLSKINERLPKDDNYDYDDFQNGRHFKLYSDSLYNYYLDVFKFKLKNTTSPLEFEKGRIKNIIINNRKVQLLKKMKEDIYTHALKKKKFDVYYKVKSNI